MKMGADRIRQLVLSLRTFSRHDEAQMKFVDLHEGLDSTLLILQHRLKEQADRTGIVVIKEYGELPLVECYSAQINQVFMNILSNGIDALEEGTVDWELGTGLVNSVTPTTDHPSPIPTIRIRTEVISDKEPQSADKVLIRIGDNGPGIPEEVRSRIFDPFFTTKPIGRGTGLGLSISYQIVVEKHNGQLRCIAYPGQGTEFQIEIPVKHSED
jgi:two-component system, NtrC family, sensor kinase